MVLTLTCGYLSADARLGETRGILHSPEGRYGEPTGETSAALKGSQDTVDVFKKEKIDISVEYEEDGRAWRITFHKKDLPESLINNLLKKNGGDRVWSKPVPYLHNKYWVTNDKQMYAVYYGNPVYKLVLMTSPAVREQRLPQSLEGRETKRVAEDASTTRKREPESDDPLDGF